MSHKSENSEKSGILSKADNLLNQQAFKIASYAFGGWAVGKATSLLYRHKLTALLALAGAGYGGKDLVKGFLFPQKSVEQLGEVVQKGVQNLSQEILETKKDNDSKKQEKK